MPPSRRHMNPGTVSSARHTAGGALSTASPPPTYATWATIEPTAKRASVRAPASRLVTSAARLMPSSSDCGGSTGSSAASSATASPVRSQRATSIGVTRAARCARPLSQRAIWVSLPAAVEGAGDRTCASGEKSTRAPSSTHRMCCSRSSAYENACHGERSSRRREKAIPVPASPLERPRRCRPSGRTTLKRANAAQRSAAASDASGLETRYGA